MPIVENPVTPVVENPETPVAPVVTPVPLAPEAFSWKTQLPSDFQNSPTLKKFEDTKDGFKEAVRSHLELERLLGYEKVPIPKGKDDSAAWSIFSKAMGIPEKPDGYGLPDAVIPDTMKGLTFDKAKFSEIVHQNRLTPEAAKGIWGAYTDMTKQAYAKAQKDHQDLITNNINQLKGEWGDAYQSKIELGQMVINKFSEDKDTNDYITAVLSKDPAGIRFLAKIGDQFAENKIGDFKYQRHSLTPEEAQNEWDSIRRDMNHPYNNDKAPQAERDRAIQYVNSLVGIARRPKG